MPGWATKILSQPVMFQCHHGLGRTEATNELTVSRVSLNNCHSYNIWNKTVFSKGKKKCMCYRVEASHQMNSFSCTYKLQFPAFLNTGGAMWLFLTKGVNTEVVITTSNPGPLTVHLILLLFLLPQFAWPYILSEVLGLWDGPQSLRRS